MNKINFTIRCSAIHQIMAGNIGLTDIQENRLQELIKRTEDYVNKVAGVKPLTDNMLLEKHALTEKRDNPELPTGAKTYCEEWLQCTEAERWPDLNSKYIEKGNLTEEDGFTLMAVQLKLGMVFKNTERRNNGYIQGEWDLLTSDTVIDNKSSWDHVTFPKYKTKMKPEHDWQLQGYMELTGVERGLLVHTLNDAPEKMLWNAVKWVDDIYEKARVIRNMVYTQAGWERAAALFFDSLPLDMYPNFKPIPDKDRIKTFSNTRDNIKIGSIYQRVNMCNSYINSLINSNN